MFILAVFDTVPLTCRFIDPEIATPLGFQSAIFIVPEDKLAEAVCSPTVLYTLADSGPCI